MNIREFEQELKTFVEKEVDQSAVNLQKQMATVALETLVYKTPVKTGHARSQWYVSIGSASDEYDKDETDKSGASTVGRGQSVINNLQPYDDIYFNNSTPYIVKLDNGHSRQAPNGMTPVAIAQVQAQFPD